jgi:hypothetical protein
MNEDGQKSKEAGERLKSSYCLRLVIMIIWNDVDGFIHLLARCSTP